MHVRGKFGEDGGGGRKPASRLFGDREIQERDIQVEHTSTFKVGRPPSPVTRPRPPRPSARRASEDGNFAPVDPSAKTCIELEHLSCASAAFVVGEGDGEGEGGGGGRGKEGVEEGVQEDWGRLEAGIEPGRLLQAQQRAIV